MKRPALTSIPITVLLVSVATIVPVAVDFYVPSLPSIARYFNTDVFHAQLTVGMFSLGLAAGQLIYGSLSDCFGRRPVLISGLMVYLVASLTCMISDSIDVLIAGRFFQALGAASGPVLARSIIRDIYAREHAARALSVLVGSMSVAVMMAPILGGYVLTAFGWQSTFIGMVGYCLVIMTAVIALLDESNKYRDPKALSVKRMAAVYGSLARDPVFMAHAFIQGCGSGSFWLFTAGSSFVLIGVLHVTPDQFGYFFGIAVCGFSGGSLATMKLTSRLGTSRMMKIAAIMGLGGSALLFLFALMGVHTVPAFLGPYVLVLFANGMMVPNNIAEALGPHARIAGSASAMIGFTQMVMASIITAITGYLFNDTTLPLASTVMALWIILCLIEFLYLSRIQAKESAKGSVAA